MNNIEENKMNNVEILYQECKVCGKSFRPPTRKELEKSILFKAAEALGIDMGNGYTGGNSLLAMLNCSVECARKRENKE
jgi:hypothetical protein